MFGLKRTTQEQYSIMDTIQSMLSSVLFSEKFPPPNVGLSDGARVVHELFWKDSFNRNLRLQDCEIEVRLGKCPSKGRGPFRAFVTEGQFKSMVESLQGFQGWEEVKFERSVVSYFPEIDESIRRILTDSGETTICSKQKVSNADFIGHDLPFDFRIAINIELPVPVENSPYTEERATRVVTRQRNSFSIGNVRYDLTRVTDMQGAVEHQVEVELINLPTIQLTCDNAQTLAVELQTRLVDLMNAVEPIRSFNISLLRKRHF